jgi:hypothetical protein
MKSSFFAIGLAQRLLGVLALGDVHRDAEAAHRPACGVVLDLAAVADPGRAAVGLQDAELESERLALRDRLLPALHEHRPVVRVHQLEHALTGRHERLGTEPEHRISLRRPPQHVITDVEVERAHPAALSARLRRSRSLRSSSSAWRRSVTSDMMLIRRCALPSGVRAATSPRPDSQTVVPSGRTIRYSAENESTLVGQHVEAPRQMAIVRMHRRLVLSRRRRRPGRARRADRSRTAPCLMGPGPRSGSQVGFPRAHAAGGQRGPVACLALAQRFLGAPGRGDVEEGRDRLQWPALDHEDRNHRLDRARDAVVTSQREAQRRRRPLLPSFEQGRSTRLRSDSSMRFSAASAVPRGSERVMDPIEKPTTRSKLSLACTRPVARSTSTDASATGCVMRCRPRAADAERSGSRRRAVEESCSASSPPFMRQV